MKLAVRDNKKENVEENTKLVCINDQHLFKESVHVCTAISTFTAI